MWARGRARVRGSGWGTVRVRGRLGGRLGVVAHEELVAEHPLLLELE